MTTKSKNSTTTPITKKRATTRVRAPRVAAAKEPAALAQYLVPGAAILGSGLLTTAGVLLKNQLTGFLNSAARMTLSQGAAVLEQLDLGTLLGHVGLQRKQSVLASPIIGAVAGLVVGSALTYWLAPILTPVIKDALAPATNAPVPEAKAVRQGSATSNNLDHSRDAVATPDQGARSV